MTSDFRQPKNEQLKAQVLRVAEVFKIGVDEVTKLVWLWIDLPSEATKNLISMKDEKRSTEKLLTVKELAEYLNVNTFIIRARTKDGSIPAMEIGGKHSQKKDYRYKLDEVERSLKTNPLQIAEAMQQQNKFTKNKR